VSSAGDDNDNADDDMMMMMMADHGCARAPFADHASTTRLMIMTRDRGPCTLVHRNRKRSLRPEAQSQTEER